MRKFFNDLSIRSKLILLIGGTVCALTAGVLTMVWVQSLRQVRSIVQEQLETNRQLFASAQRSHYRTHAFEAESLAMRVCVRRLSASSPNSPTFTIPLIFKPARANTKSRK
jgi:hypothetical protein